MKSKLKYLKKKKVKLDLAVNHRDLSSSPMAHKTWNVLVAGKGARKSSENC